MPWQAPERPEWVRAVNANEVPLLSAEADLPLSREALVSEALARLGRSAHSTADIEAALGHPDFPAEVALARLERFLRAVEEEAALSLIGRWMTRRFVLRLLEVRVQLMQWLQRDPDVRNERIESPIFVAGAPRTATTILHRLLAADPAHRVPEGWELLRPVPPPSPDPTLFAEDPRIPLADRELVLPQTIVSGLLSIHEYGGRRPKECLSAQSFAFESEEFTARYAVPSFARELLEAGMGDAYQMHRLVLQVLQRGHPACSWVLKSPVHLHDLPTLFETYPDARVAITHRDPITLLASLTSLIANLRWAHSERVDPVAIAREHIERYAQTFDQLVDWTETGAIPADRIHHSHFRDFQNEPIETVAALYDRFERPLSSAACEAMRAALAAEPTDRHGAHAYSADDLPGDPAQLRARFERYQKAFSVPTDA